MPNDTSGSNPGQPAHPPANRARRWRHGRALLVGLLAMTTIGCSAVAASLTPTPAPPSPPGAAALGQSPHQVPGLRGMGGLVTPRPAAPGKHAGQAPAAGGRSDVTGGAMFGGDIPLLSQQGKLGRSLAIVRVYDLLGQSFPGAQVRRILAGGSTVLVSLDTHPGMATYASIAAGREDGIISRYLREVNQAAVTYHLAAIYICFEHEVDNTKRHAGLGSPAQFVQAWDHIHGLAAAAHLDWNQGGRLHWVWLLEHGAFFSSAASAYWPGSGEVDILGVDGYNTGGCRTANGNSFLAAGIQMQAPAYLFGPALSFASAHGLPVFIAEWASAPYRSQGVQPEFIRQMQEYVTSHPQIGAALYWDSQQPGSACNFNIDSLQASMTALAAMGRSAGLQASVASF